MERFNCLIVDDEEALSLSTCEYFNMFGVKTFWAANPEACLAFLRDRQTDLILLDINLGNASGFALCKKLRESTDIPILFISARSSDDDVLLALNIGGDDYIAKPYSLSVLLAKVRVVLKRRQVKAEPAVSFGAFTLNLERESLWKNGEEVVLKAMEYRLLAYLTQNANRTISKEELFAQVWRDAVTGDGTLNVHIRRLREKIEDNPNEPYFIRTVWGTGYLFKKDETAI